jgi:hypothetical protein
MAAPLAPLLIFGGLSAWGIYRRIRRNIGRQKLRPRRIIIRLVVLSIISVIFIGISLQLPKLMLGIGGGLLLGIGLGFVGLKLTKFETTEAGHFYTPDTRIGIALTALLAGRVLYRLWILNDVTASATTGGGPPPAAFQSALTFLIFGLNAGYYLVYSIGLFVHTHDKK